MEKNQVIESETKEEISVEMERTLLKLSKIMLKAKTDEELIVRTSQSFLKLLPSLKLSISYYDWKDVLHHYDVDFNEDGFTMIEEIQLHQLICEEEHPILSVHKLHVDEDYFGCLRFTKIGSFAPTEFENDLVCHLSEYLSIALHHLNEKKAFREKSHSLEEKHVHLIKNGVKKDHKHYHLLKLSYIDKLTECYNRRFYEENLDLLKTEDYLPLGIIIADVNSLKVFNDAFGHHIGDELLRVIAKVLRETCGHLGSVSRVGGDEFSVLLPNTTKEKLRALVNRVHLNLLEVNTLPIKPSLSIGRTMHKKGAELRETLSRAENMMYEQKLVSSDYVKRTIIESLKARLNNYASQNKERVEIIKKLSLLMGEALDLSGEEKIKLNLLAEVHNIGEVGINKELFLKSSRLTLKEFDMIKSHVKRGYRIVNASVELRKISDEMLSHHEKWDGSGYPRAIKGNEIPKVSRAFSVIDAYSSMLTNKVYHTECSKFKAIEELYNQSSKHFDPFMVDVFVSKVLK